MRTATSPDNENTDRPGLKPRRCEFRASDPALYQRPSPALRHHQDTVPHVSHGKAKPAALIQTRQSKNSADPAAKVVVHASSSVSLEHILCHAMTFRPSVSPLDFNSEAARGSMPEIIQGTRLRVPPFTWMRVR